MIKLTRNEAQLLLAAIRVLVHRQERSPTPEEVAELLQMSASPVRMQLAALQDLGAIALVTSAFETHAEIRDPATISELPEEAGPAISEDIKDFDRRKQEEAEKMAHLFDSGEHEKQKQEQLRRMDADLRAFKRKKPDNPFGDD